MEKIVQTAGRATLGEFAPEFAHFNDDVLFGENWNNQDIDVKDKKYYHSSGTDVFGNYGFIPQVSLAECKRIMVLRREEIAAIITHVAFYAGWPKGWAVFNLAKGRYGRLNEGELTLRR